MFLKLQPPKLHVYPNMIPPCHQGIQKLLHTHWKYPSGSGIYSHTVSHFPTASHRLWSDRPTVSTLFTVTSSQGHLNHVITIMAHPLFTEFGNLYRPRTKKKSWRRRALFRTLPTTLNVGDWENNGTVSDSTCAARCRLLFETDCPYSVWGAGLTNCMSARFLSNLF